MANPTRDLRRRIRSIRNTSQLTRAMKMVSAAKLRRAQETMLAARPYAESLRHVLGSLARRVDPSLHPLLVRREEKIVECLVLTGDKGLCGSFNTNILRAAEGAWREHTAAGRQVRLNLIGKRGVDYFRRRPQYPVVERRQDVFRSVDYRLAEDLAHGLEQRFVEGEVDAVLLVYNQFRSTMSQRVAVEPLLPFAGLSAEPVDEGYAADYIYEPAPRDLLDALIPRFVTFSLYRALLESCAAEHAARMTAMESATKNAEELINKLTLRMNRVRQASITSEIIEVVSGAQALT